MVFTLYFHEMEVFLENIFYVYYHNFHYLLLVFVVQSLSHVRLCDPKDCSTPISFVLHYLPKFALIHVQRMRCCLTISSSVIPFSSCLQSFPTSGSFPVSWLFASGGQSIGASASASVLPMNIQG